MPTLIATPGAVDANSYCTVAEAQAYHDVHLYASTWNDADSDNQIIALIWATRLLDEQYTWLGERTTQAQALRWPRYGVLDRDDFILEADAIPQFLKNATAEFARQLLASDRFATLDSAASGIKSVKAGSVAVEFDKYDRITVFPEAVNAMVLPYAAGGQSDGMTVSLVRA